LFLIVNNGHIGRFTSILLLNYEGHINLSHPKTLKSS